MDPYMGFLEKSRGFGLRREMTEEDLYMGSLSFYPK